MHQEPSARDRHSYRLQWPVFLYLHDRPSWVYYDMYINQGSLLDFWSLSLSVQSHPPVGAFFLGSKPWNLQSRVVQRRILRKDEALCATKWQNVCTFSSCKNVHKEREDFEARWPSGSCRVTCMEVYQLLIYAKHLMVLSYALLCKFAHGLP